jgi:hypothetical protein
MSHRNSSCVKEEFRWNYAAVFLMMLWAVFFLFTRK